MIRAIVDSNVLFEGLTKHDSASTFVLRAWQREQFQPCVSLALRLEYYDVLTRKLSPKRWKNIQPVLKTLLIMARPVVPYYHWRPMSPDPGDDHIIDCAMNASAWIVTYNIRDFILARMELGLVILTPGEFLIHLKNVQD